ncbi:MAG TPA: hypothetical protein VK518_23780 [Puia sp.]|nr:hypothetical protein [Puia sp.]
MSLSRGKILNWAVLLIATLALLLPIILVERQVLTHTEGDLILPQDQSFITIDVGKNLAFYGVWGLSKYAFQPAASSLLYPVILVPFFFIAGANLLIPLLLNAVAAILLIRVVQRQLIRKGLPPLVQMAVVLLFIFFTPLPLLVISGMEYTLFLLFVALFITSFSKAACGLLTRRPAKFIDRLPWSVYVYGALVVATRFEGIILVAAICIQLLYWQRKQIALRLGVAGFIPILLFGLISLSKGGRFIPPAMLQPLGGVIYTTALIGVGLLILTLTAPLQYKTQWLASSLFGIIAIFRTTSLLEYATSTTIETYHQQIQAARFVHRYYYRAGVSLNETGAVSFFSEGRKVDLTGIATYSFLRGKQRFYSSPMLTDSISWWEGARLGILSGPESTQKPAGRWQKVTSWNNPHDIVSFYTLDTASGRRLKEHMQEYQRLLPPYIQVRYY